MSLCHRNDYLLKAWMPRFDKRKYRVIEVSTLCINMRDNLCLFCNDTRKKN